MKDLYYLRAMLPERTLTSEVYDGYRATRDEVFARFQKSSESFDKLSSYRLPTYAPIRKPIPEKAYKGLTICGLPLEEVGCGVFSLIQGLTKNYQVVDRNTVEEITHIIEEKGYYKVGSGLYWHIFMYFAGYHPSCWYELVTAIEFGRPVTVLLNMPGRKSRLFTNLLGTINQKAYVSGSHCETISNPEEFSFITSEGERISLAKLMEPGFLATAPWIWPITL